MIYKAFLKGNYWNFRKMYGLTEQFDACEYEGRHAFLWYNPLNTDECYVAIEFINRNECLVCDVIKSSEIKPEINVVQEDPLVCDIKNKTQIKNKILQLAKFIYDMDNGRI